MDWALVNVTLSNINFLFFYILTFMPNGIGEKRLREKGSVRMVIDDNEQHDSPSILDVLLCKKRDTFRDDLDANSSDCEINNEDPYVRKLQSLSLFCYNLCLLFYCNLFLVLLSSLHLVFC